MLSFLSECSICDSWIREAMEDLFLSFPCSSFITQTFLFSLLSECNLSDLRIPEAMEDLLLSCPSFMVVITLICTRHAYLASGHLKFLLFQNTAEQLFLKTPFIKAHTPCSITACVYTLADPRQPACTYKSTKKGKLLTEHTTLGELTKPFGHAWPMVRPNT
jgi:hypothetical protein